MKANRHMTTRTEITVRYAETDAQGVVHHANYLVWFEEGRSDFLRQQGLNYTEFEKAGFFIVVAQAELKYKAPAFYEERLVIETTLSQIRAKVMKFNYRILDRQEVVRAEGQTVHMVVGQDKKPTTLPDAMMGKLSALKADG